MAETLFHGGHMSLVRWFWVIYFLGSNKGSISAVRLSKLIEVNWHAARQILKKFRLAVSHQDSLYSSSSINELDDALIGNRHKDKGDRSANWKTSVLIAF